MYRDIEKKVDMSSLFVYFPPSPQARRNALVPILMAVGVGGELVLDFDWGKKRCIECRSVFGVSIN